MARAIVAGSLGVAAHFLPAFSSSFGQRQRQQVPARTVACDGGAGMKGDSFEYKLGPPDSGFSIFLADRAKKVHFIRHAEGFHNVATKEAKSNDILLAGDTPASEHELWDSQLTPAGIAQADKLRDHLKTRPSSGKPYTRFDLVVVSPLTRTLQTADAIFGPARQPGTPAFIDEGQERQNGGAAPGEYTAKMARPKILVREECRERWGLYVCDGRRPIREIMPEFPGFDFSELEYDEDVFYTDEREPDEHCCQRAVEFLNWLNRRPEKCIAVVTHSSFLRHLFQQFGGNTAADDKETLQRLAGNCELRSVVLCSHGVKERTSLEPMRKKKPSTVEIN